MFKHARPTAAQVVSILALVVALCGGAYAAASLPKKSVGPKQLKNGAVKTKKIADSAVTSPKVADGSLQREDLAPGVISSTDSYTKAESDARYYSKGESDGRYYTKGESDSRYLSSAGATVLQASPVDWQVTNAAFPGAAGISYDTAGISLISGSAGSTSIVIAPTLPAELAGQPQTLLGVNACYNTSSATTVTAARINVVTNTNGSPSTTPAFEDATARTDAACRDYIPSTPVALDATHSVGFEFSVSFAGGGGNSFSAGRTTFTLAP